MKVIFFVANRGYALYSSRRELISALLSAGYKVVLLTSEDIFSRELASIGAVVENISFDRGGLSIRNDFKSFIAIFRLLRKYKPDLVHCFHAKPIILTAFAARGLSRKIKIVSTITGLGHAFIKGGFVARLAGIGYRTSIPYTEITIFQNSDDLKLFEANNWIGRSGCKLIVGSGVDVEKFKYISRAPTESVNVLMLGRLLAQKGVNEFIAVADIIQRVNAFANFIWAGEVDSVHPDAVAPASFDGTNAHYYGHVSNVPELLERSDLFVFPSYREGVPRAIMEASASGIPTVAFDVPGVREVVEDGVTGYLVPFGDVDAMAQKTHYLIQNPDVRLEMGRKARALVESSFDSRVINQLYIETYQSLGICVPNFQVGGVSNV